MVPGDGTEALQRCGEYTYKQGELRGIVGEERRGEVRKWMDVPLQYVDLFLLSTLPELCPNFGYELCSLWSNWSKYTLLLMPTISE
jgi:hypothetical protein